jgi:23S rRNA (cytosine1962-C5)-methyltransferase
LPGLIIDIYHKVAVIQCHSVGMLHDITNIAMAIKEVFDKNIEAVYSKSAEAMHQTGVAGGAQNGFIVGKCDTSFQILENGHKFTIDLVKGQKTGFFLDQRENRKLLSLYSKGKKVLNTFSYTGGFSIYAKAAGAQEVVSVDVSATAMHMATENFKLNQLQYNDTDFVIEDCQKYLQGDISRFDVVILDPPAYAKNIKKRHNAVMGYKRLNALAMRNMKPGSILLTFSCSQVVDKLLFQSTIQAAAIEARKNVKILHYLHQPSDHPVDVCHPESEYLKGLMVYVF